MRNKLRPQPRLQSTIRLQRIVAASIAFLLIAIGAIVWFQMGNEQDAKAANLQGYDYMKIITIDHDKVEGSTDLVDFPVLIYHTDPDLRTVANGGYVQSSTGVDIRTALVDGTELKQELEYYDGATGEIALWVKVPNLSTSIDTEIELYFGNTNPNPSNATANVWNNDFKGVYHFGGNIDDATESWDANRHGHAQTENNGFIGKAEKFDGNGDYLTIHQSVLPNTGDFSISFWVNLTTINNNNSHYFFDMEGSGNAHLYFDYNDQKIQGTEWATWFYNDDNNTTAEVNKAGFTSNTWTHIVAVGSWNDNRSELYVNGTLVGYDYQSMGDIFSNPSELYIAANKYNNSVADEINGIIDELRISKGLSNHWIKTEYNNQSDPLSFYSINDCLIPVAGPTTLANYTQRIELTVDHNYVAGEEYTNFPIRVALTDATLKTTINGGSMENGNGFDAFFTDADGTTPLDFEIEAYDGDAGELVAWVQVPTITACYDSKFYLYFGRPGQTVDPSTSSIWGGANGFEVVSHFHGNVADQSGNGNNGVDNGTASATGLIGDARKFEGGTDEISYGSLINQSAGTISFWFKPNNNFNSSLTTTQTLVSKYESVNEYFYFAIAGSENEFANAGELYFEIDNVSWGRVRSGITTWNSNTWYHVTGTWESTGMSLYIDGSLIGTAPGTYAMDNSDDLKIGYGNIIIDSDKIRGVTYYNAETRSLDATVDEFRLSTSVRSAEWVETEYNAMSGNMVTNSAPTPLNPNGWLLPVELSYFTATPTKNGEVELAWETLVEINNDFFTIERSADGKSFEPIMKVSGMINSSSPTRYVEYDTAPLSGYSFYRLKQTDLDGQSETFPIQQVYIAPADVSLQIVQAYPNPTVGPVTVVVQSDEAQTVTAQIIDASGRMRWSDNWSLWSQQERFNIDLSDYAAGYYILQVTTESGQQETIKLLRAR